MGPRHVQLTFGALRHVLQPLLQLRASSNLFLFADGWHRLGRVLFLGLVVDYEELMGQLCCVDKRCPLCEQPRDLLRAGVGTPRTLQRAQLARADGEDTARALGYHMDQVRRAERRPPARLFGKLS